MEGLGPQQIYKNMGKAGRVSKDARVQQVVVVKNKN